MIIQLASLLFALSVSSGFVADPQLKLEWRAFKVKHGKEYSSAEEEEMRLGLYVRHREEIAAHNERFAAGLESYRLAMNGFGDLTEEEFSGSVLAGNRTRRSTGLSYNLTAGPLPARVSWQDRGAVTPPKDQGRCGSCWSFSVIAALESHHKIKYGRLVRLSEQNLLDCSSNMQYRNDGCGGGWTGNAYQYVIDNGGVDTEESYPYQGTVGPCRFRRAAVGASCRAFVQLPGGNQRALQSALASKGPLSVAMDASRTSFRFYAGGFYNDPFCGQSANPLNHAVLAVGYDRDRVFGNYWVLKNSWGSGWGERGFFRVPFGFNLCNIASAPTYPVL